MINRYHRNSVKLHELTFFIEYDIVFESKEAANFCGFFAFFLE